VWGCGVGVKAIFLDRDGVINENRPDHVKSWDEFAFLPGAVEAIARVSRASVPVFVISNQAIVNRGIVTHDAVDAINSRMVRAIEAQGGRIEDVVFCPHRDEEMCDCRKPRPGLLLRLAQSHSLDLREAAFIGDALTDMEAGQAVGCQTILVLTGRGREQLEVAEATGRNGFGVATTLDRAIEALLGASESR
jgi:D-glycero-D-manno-heptose 1,7-bisphosphate phosphatase